MKPRSMLILLLSAILLGACFWQAQPATTTMPAKAAPAPSPISTENPTPLALPTITPTPLSRKPPEVTIYSRPDLSSLIESYSDLRPLLSGISGNP